MQQSSPKTKVILAISTADQIGSIALAYNHAIHEYALPVPQRQGETILSSIKILLQQHELTISDLDAIAFNVGPGSFTGTRLAAGITQGLSFVHNIPIVAVSNLQALALAAHQEFKHHNILIALDAYRANEIYLGLFSFKKGPLPVIRINDCVTAIDNLNIPKLDETELLVITNLETASQKKLLENITKHSIQSVVKTTNNSHAAHCVATLAQAKYLNNEFVSLSDAIPVYLQENLYQKQK